MKITMGLLDSIVDKHFRDDRAGRVVVFTGDRRNRGYIVRSESEELKIRSFLKMFYFAHFSILLLGCALAYAWSIVLSHALGGSVGHWLRSGVIFLVLFSLVVGAPYWLLWRAYKHAFLGFVSAQDKVLVSEKSAGRRFWIVIAGLGTLVLVTLMLLGIIFSPVRTK